MTNVEITDSIGKVDLDNNSQVYKMLVLAKEVAKDTSNKFSGGSLDILGSGISKSNAAGQAYIIIHYLPPKTKWWKLRSTIVFMKFYKSPEVSEILTKVMGDPKYISSEQVAFAKTAIDARSRKLGLKIKWI